MSRARSTSAKLTARLLLAGAVIGAIACRDTVAPSRSDGPSIPSSAAASPWAAPLGPRGLVAPFPGAGGPPPGVVTGLGTPLTTPEPFAQPLSLMGGATGKLHCSSLDPATASAWIGPEGGTLRIGRHRLVVPPGALSEPVLITGIVPADSSATVRFEPSGLKFAAPATLVFGVTGCDAPGDNPSVMYIDDAGQPLEALPSVFDRAREEVSTPIYHFSGYQVWV